MEDFLKPQGRFAHFNKPENEWLLKKIQQQVDREWDNLIRAESAKSFYN